MVTSASNSQVSAEAARLRIEFDVDEPDNFLVDAVFDRMGAFRRSHKLKSQPPGEKGLRAFCILMLLAKYQGELSPDDLTEMPFFVATKDWTWIGTLDGACHRTKGQDFCSYYFFQIKIFRTTRGSLHTASNKALKRGSPPTATYDPLLLNPRNLEIVRTIKGSAVTETMRGKDLVAFAKKLEDIQIKKDAEKNKIAADNEEEEERPWTRCVPILVEQIKKDCASSGSRPNKQSTPSKTGISQPFIFSAQCRSLFVDVAEEVSARMPGGDWYIVTGAAIWMSEWESVFLNAVEHNGARIKCAYHLPDAAKTCPTIEAQSRMNSGDVHSHHSLTYLDKSFAEFKRTMLAWTASARKRCKDAKRVMGSVEFYESRIAHPYMAILCVPKADVPFKTGASAPTGTWCLSALDALYYSDFDERCALYLHSSSQMLDKYYNSILAFFSIGVENDYLSPATWY